MSLRSEVVRIFNELVASGKKISELPAASTPLVGNELVELSQNGVSVHVTASNLSSGGTGVQSVVAGTNITVDDTDPQNPIISSSGGGAPLTDGSGTTANGTAVDLGGEITGNTIIADDGSGWDFELAQNGVRFGNIRGYASGGISLDGAASTLLQSGTSSIHTNATDVDINSSAGSIKLSSDTGLIVTDNQASKTGLMYAASGYVTQPQSLADKEYVDSVGADAEGAAATVQANLTAHIDDDTNAHAAQAISYEPTGGIESTTVQNAITELDSEKQPIDVDLTAIAGLGFTSESFLRKTGAGNWTLDTTTYLPLGGGTLTGFLTLNSIPTDAMHAATKEYVDDAAAAITTGTLAQFAPTTSAELATVISDEVGTGNLVFSEPAVNVQTSSYSLVLSDKAKEVRMNVAGSNNLTIPLNSTVAFPVGTLIVLTQYGAGTTTVVATGGVTVRSSSGNLLSPGQYSPMVLRKIGTDEWYLWNGTSVTTAALTKTDDTNVTITLTGSPGNALNAATGIVAGWSGSLAVTRGGSGTATAFTTGSVVFAGASGVYTQDNANLFFDNTNNRLGIGTATPNSALHVNGATAFAYSAKTANYTLAETDRFIECTTGSFTTTLPTAVGITGRTYTIDNSGAGTITLATTSSQTIDGAAPGSLTTGQKITVYSNGANWRTY